MTPKTRSSSWMVIWFLCWRHLPRSCQPCASMSLWANCPPRQPANFHQPSTTRNSSPAHQQILPGRHLMRTLPAPCAIPLARPAIPKAWSTAIAPHTCTHLLLPRLTPWRSPGEIPSYLSSPCFTPTPGGWPMRPQWSAPNKFPRSLYGPHQTCSTDARRACYPRRRRPHYLDRPAASPCETAVRSFQLKPHYLRRLSRSTGPD